MFVLSLENNAMERILGYCDWPIALFLAPRLQAIKQFGVENRYPSSLTRLPPMLKYKEYTRGVIYTGVLRM